MKRHPKVELLTSKTLISGSVFDVVEESVRLPSGLRQDVLVVDVLYVYAYDVVVRIVEDVALVAHAAGAHLTRAFAYGLIPGSVFSRRMALG